MTSRHHDGDMTTPRTSSPESRLRIVLGTNATTSGLGGFVAAVAPGPVDDVLGTGQEGWVRLVGLGLVAFAVLVAVTSRLDRERLLWAVPGISLGDGSWVIGTVIAIALGWFSTSGAVVMGVIGLMVGVFGVEQALLVRSLTTRDRVVAAASPCGVDCSERIEPVEPAVVRPMCGSTRPSGSS